jgi:hypothetical protein
VVKSLVMAHIHVYTEQEYLTQFHIHGMFDIPCKVSNIWKSGLSDSTIPYDIVTWLTDC